MKKIVQTGLCIALIACLTQQPMQAGTQEFINRYKPVGKRIAGAALLASSPAMAKLAYNYAATSRYNIWAAVALTPHLRYLAGPGHTIEYGKNALYHAGLAVIAAYATYKIAKKGLKLWKEGVQDKQTSENATQAQPE